MTEKFVSAFKLAAAKPAECGRVVVHSLVLSCAVDASKYATKSLHQRVRELGQARTTAEQQARRQHDAIAADLRVAERQVATQQA